MINFSLTVKSFIVNENNELLIIKREPKDVHAPAIWEIPGGRLDHGENPVKGLKRETKEETNLEIEIVNPLSVQHFTRDDGQIITMIIFLCRPMSEMVILSEEHTDYDWVDLNKDVSKLSHFFQQEVKIFKKHFE